MEIIKKKLTPLLIIFFLVIIVALPSTLVTAQNEKELESAEINSTIIGEIPSINTSEWTPIKILVEDEFGLNWTYLKEKFPTVTMRLIWPLMFGRDIGNYLGYTKLEFEPEIYVGNKSGWELKVVPPTIGGTTGGMNHTITLYAQVDELAADYSVVIRIKCTRVLPNGDEAGVNYIYVPVKANAFNKVFMTATDIEKTTTPRSIIQYKVDVRNEGFYEDIFNFKAVSKDKGIIGVISESALALKPGETKTITLFVQTPNKFFDPGTPHKIDIYVTSINDPNQEYIGTVRIVTQGFYFSELAIFSIIAPIILLIIVIFLFKKFGSKLLKRRKKTKNKTKPETIKKTEQKTESLPLKQETPEKSKEKDIRKTKEESKKEKKPTIAVQEQKPKIDKRKEKAIQKAKREQKKQKKYI